MDGLELTETLKQDQSTQALPVVILTGCAFEQDREQANQGWVRSIPDQTMPSGSAGDSASRKCCASTGLFAGKPAAVEGV